MDEHDFKNVVRSLEEQDRITEEIYELENIKHVYGPKHYNKVMSEIYDENYDQAIEILEKLEQRGE